MSHSPEPLKDSASLRLFDRLILGFPLPVVLLMAGVTVYFTYYVKDFKMNASSDSIILENDADMRYYVGVTQDFGADEFVALTFTPPGDMFGDKALADIKAISEDCLKVPGVNSVTSILNAPLFHSPDVPLLKLGDGYKSVQMPETPRDLAKKELTESPLFGDFLISRDAKSTILQVNFAPSTELNELYFERYALREERRLGTITPERAAKLVEVEAAYGKIYETHTETRRAQIDAIREIMVRHKDAGELFLGGVPMVIADIVNYVERDIKVFGLLVLLFIVIMLYMVFRRVNFMILPMLTCVFAVVWMMGWLGVTEWHTTIVTANFTSLLLIITTENAIHLATHYRMLRAERPDLPNRKAILEAVGVVHRPCLFATLTTCVGFISLYVSGLSITTDPALAIVRTGIPPVMDFGLMMTLGLIVSYVICFVFMPAGLMLMPIREVTEEARARQAEEADVTVLAHLTERHKLPLIAGWVVLFAFCALGIPRLTVENRFMDYFRKSTPVYQGMMFIDESLGGTTPLDIIIDGDGPEYWMEKENQDRLRVFHAWLEQQPELGKIVSLDTMLRLLEGVNKGKPLAKPMLGMVRSRIPAEIASSVLTPYVNDDFSRIRVSTRARESSKNMARVELMERIERFAVEEAGFKPEQIRLTGMFKLYNNMLQTLFTNQIKTVSTVFLACLITFTFVFRNFFLALIGLVPNILAVTVILGTIGWLNIPLDMMTVMIAAITFGLADDNTIHYIHRFKEEFRKDGDYLATMYRCHNSVGRALSYSMITIVFGFAVLVLSNFVPTVYFGIFTGIAIFLALLASHTILPLMILAFKPLGRGNGHGEKPGKTETEGETA